MTDRIAGQLLDLSRRLTPWSDAEERMAVELGDLPFLGGDGLRPYAIWRDGDAVNLCAVVPDNLPVAPLVAEVLRGDFGLPISFRSDDVDRIRTVRLAQSPELSARLSVRQVLLVALADAERYRGARLPLGVARLAQWLRFTHSARVHIVDYNFDPDPLDAVQDILRNRDVDIAGVSVNFGQWNLLAELAGAFSGTELPAVVLGNILAAYAPQEAAALFDEAQPVLVATTLGERPLERLCQLLDEPVSWVQIDGLVRASSSSVEGLGGEPSRPDIVMPDESMILNVSGAGGQISFETSFGCQYGACTFCPRDHKGDGWERGGSLALRACLERLAMADSPISIVDEEFFGSEGLSDPPNEHLASEDVLRSCRELGIEYEIYTRIEQIFDRRRSRDWNIARASLLHRERHGMRRLFLGVESGCPAQLRRYGKGQTVRQIVDALRVASAIGVPMEFGFITFDPLLTPSDLLANIQFLSRTDVVLGRQDMTQLEVVQFVDDYIGGRLSIQSNVPVYRHVAYMATELEVLTTSSYGGRLARRFPELLSGVVDVNFARLGAYYADERIAEIAGWCRAWTEGMFTPIYEMRMQARSSRDRIVVSEVMETVGRYRDATFSLLTDLARELLPEIGADLPEAEANSLTMGEPSVGKLSTLGTWTLGERAHIEFDTDVITNRRSR